MLVLGILISALYMCNNCRIEEVGQLLGHGTSISLLIGPHV